MLYYYGEIVRAAKLLGRVEQAASPINVTLWKWTEIEEFMCMALVSILMSTRTLKGSFCSLAGHSGEIKICDDKAHAFHLLLRETEFM